MAAMDFDFLCSLSWLVLGGDDRPLLPQIAALGRFLAAGRPFQYGLCSMARSGRDGGVAAGDT